MKLRINTPEYLVAIFLVLVMGVIILLHLLAQQDIYFVNKISLGYDYHAFYEASMQVREGESPYLVARYQTPPIPAIINVPFTFISFEVVRVVVSILTFFSVVLSLFIVHRIFSIPNKLNDANFFIAIITILCFSYPFQFLFDRGNIDGFVLLLMCCGLFFLKRHDALAGAIFGLAISMKIYPILIIFPLIWSRRWRTLLFIGMMLVFLFLLTPQMWIEFLQKRISYRTSRFSIFENGSIANTFYYIGVLFGAAELLKK